MDKISICVSCKHHKTPIDEEICNSCHITHKIIVTASNFEDRFYTLERVARHKA